MIQANKTGDFDFDFYVSNYKKIINPLDLKEIFGLGLFLFYKVLLLTEKPSCDFY